MAFAFALVPEPSDADPSFELPTVWRLMSAPPASAEDRLALADQAIRALEASGAPNPSVLIDLMRIRSAALIELGRTAQAAMSFERKADLAHEMGLSVERDPVVFYNRAEDLHASTGNGAASARAKGKSKRMQDSARTIVEGTEGRSNVRLLYATDRARSGMDGPLEFYSYDRGGLESGEVTVSIPPNHRRGQMEQPSLLRLEFGAKAGRHVVLEEVVPLVESAFLSKLQDRLADAKTREVLVYIHGYNVSFDTAMRRAAQIVYDLRYDGVPVVYSWPSHGTTFGYIADSAAVRHSGRNLKEFLSELVETLGDEKIHLIAHSMGNRALTDALELLAVERGATIATPPIFQEVVFAAPDVDAGLFGVMSATFKPLARRMTVYASSEDVALSVSKRLHGRTPRAGQGGDEIHVFDGIDSIDMSAVGDDLMSHDYFAEDSTALLDLLTLFWRNAPPSARCGLEAVSLPAGQVWRLRPGLCSDRRLLDIMSDLRTLGVADRDTAERYLDEIDGVNRLRGHTRTIVLQIFSDPVQ
ncbi:MAG: alpha/beta fold hydrolase [Pseudomonadota bacterium]